MQVLVRDNNVDQALRALKKKMQREGIFREMKMRDYFESGCLCILKDKTLQKAPAEMSNEDAVKLYMDNCKCSRHPEYGLRKG